MAYPNAAQGDVTEVRVQGFSFGTTTFSVFHYMIDQVGASQVPFNIIWDELNVKLSLPGGLFESLYNCCSTKWVHVQTYYQRVAPTRSPYYIKQSAGGAGTVAGDALPLFNSCEIIKQTNAAGKGFSGKLFVPSCPVSFVQNETIIGAGQGPLDALGNSILGNIPVPPATYIHVPIVWSHRRPNDRHTMLRCYFNPYVRTLRKRLHGKGI